MTAPVHRHHPSCRGPLDRLLGAFGSPARLTRANPDAGRAENAMAPTVSHRMRAT